MSEFAVAAIVFFSCFLLGSIPFGLIVSRIMYGKDIRSEGSGNIGTTNALRTLGKKGGALVFALDFGKGVLSGFIGLAANWFLMPGGGLTGDTTFTYYSIIMFSMMGAVFGHIFSPWLKFKGGKGIAVAIGCLFPILGPIPSFIELAIFGIFVATTRYVSLGSIMAAGAFPIFAALFFLHPAFTTLQDQNAFMMAAVCALVIIWAHRGNIVRLYAGTERKLGETPEETAARVEARMKEEQENYEYYNQKFAEKFGSQAEAELASTPKPRRVSEIESEAVTEDAPETAEQ